MSYLKKVSDLQRSFAKVLTSVAEIQGILTHPRLGLHSPLSRSNFEWPISSPQQVRLEYYHITFSSQWRHHHTLQIAPRRHMYNSISNSKAVHRLCFSAAFCTRSHTAKLLNQHILLVYRSADECKHSSSYSIHKRRAGKQQHGRSIYREWAVSGGGSRSK